MPDIQLITPEIINGAYTYTSYRQLINMRLAQGQSTSQLDSQALAEYSKMNVQRMRRGDKTFVLGEALSKIISELKRPMLWLVITEGWCGDAAQIIPGLVKMAEGSDQLEVRFILRDEHPSIMDAYLTNGSRSIPKLISLDPDTLEELFVWGPRPVPAQKILEANKAKDLPYVEELHKWYALNKGVVIQEEFVHILEQYV